MRSILIATIVALTIGAGLLFAIPYFPASVSPISNSGLSIQAMRKILAAQSEFPASASYTADTYSTCW